MYVFAVPTVYTYTAEATLKVASLHKYGELAAAMQTDGMQGMAVATALVNSGFNSLKANLSSGVTGNDFSKANVDFSGVTFAVSIPKGSRDSIVLAANSNKNIDLSEGLTAFLGYASERTVEELNTFLQGMGVKPRMEVDMLYQLDSPSVSQFVQAKPKKKLIVVVGFVAGAMLGVFAALLRSAIRKRRSQAEVI